MVVIPVPEIELSLPTPPLVLVSAAPPAPTVIV
jgi:hypothetical protein